MAKPHFIDLDTPRDARGRFAPKVHDEPTAATAALAARDDTTVRPIDEDDVHVFTEGDCGYLAEHIEHLTGWPIVVVADGEGPDTPLGWVHAGVRMPDGRVLDVEGAWLARDWVFHWGETADQLGCDIDGYDGDQVDVYGADVVGYERQVDDFEECSAAHQHHADGTACQVAAMDYQRAAEIAAMLVAAPPDAPRFLP